MAISWVVIIPAAILAVIVLYGLFTVLQKKLKVFTRGTVTFMVLAVLVGTGISYLSFLHDIKLNEQRIKRESRNRTVSEFLRAWLDKGREEAAGLLSVPSDRREGVRADLESLERAIGDSLDEVNARGETFADLTLVALDVNRDYERSWWANGRQLQKQFGFRALFDDGGRELRYLQGQVFVEIPDSGALTITGVGGDLVEYKSHELRRRCSYVFHRASVFRSPQYQYHRGAIVRRE